MFNWVCPRCGKDVPPSKTECPFCVDAGPVEMGPPVPPQAMVPMPPQAVQPQYPPPPPPPQAYAQPQYAPPQQQYPPQYQAPPQGWAPPQKQGMPPWLAGVAVCFGLAGLFAAAYMFLSKPSAPAAAPEVAAATKAAEAAPAVNPLQKYVEVTGLRLVTENKQLMVKFLVVNHSAAEMAGVSGKVTVSAGESKADSVTVGTFSFVAKALGANGSVELSSPFETKMKAYELPDWQTTTTEVVIAP